MPCTLPSNVTVESAGDGHGKTIGLLQVASSCICPVVTTLASDNKCGYCGRIWLDCQKSGHLPASSVQKVQSVKKNSAIVTCCNTTQIMYRICCVWFLNGAEHAWFVNFQMQTDLGSRSEWRGWKFTNCTCIFSKSHTLASCVQHTVYRVALSLNYHFWHIL